MSIILATGGLGFIGSHICLKILEEGLDVLIIDSLVNSSSKVINNIEKIVIYFFEKVILEIVNSLRAFLKSLNYQENQ